MRMVPTLQLPSRPREVQYPPPLRGSPRPNLKLLRRRRQLLGTLQLLPHQRTRAEKERRRQIVVAAREHPNGRQLPEENVVDKIG